MVQLGPFRVLVSPIRPPKAMQGVLEHEGPQWGDSLRAGGSHGPPLHHRGHINLHSRRVW